MSTEPEFPAAVAKAEEARRRGHEHDGEEFEPVLERPWRKVAVLLTFETNGSDEDIDWLATAAFVQIEDPADEVTGETRAQTVGVVIEEDPA
jgi:hypothetical protein